MITTDKINEQNMNPTGLYESLFILYKCNRSINLLWQVVNSHQNATGGVKEIAVILTNNIKMESVSFLEEFNESFFHNIEDEYKPRMRDIRQITAPIIKRIKKWKDLEKYRNNIITHPWRDKGKLAIPDANFYNIPQTWFDVFVLVNLMNYLWQLIYAEFTSELNAALVYVAKLKPPDKPSSTVISEVNADHGEMAREIDNISKNLNKPYFLKVLKYQEPKDNEDN
jgi:hypothetical protein